MASMKEKYGHNFKTTSKKNEKDDKKTSSGKSMQEKYGHNFTGAQRESQKPSTVISSKNTQAASLRRGGASPDGVDTAEDIALRRNTSRATYEQELTAAKKKSSAASAILTDEALFDNSSMEENLRRLQESRQAKNNADNIEKKLDIMDLTEKWGNTAYREIEDADSFGDKWDNFWSQTGANIGAGRLSQETSRAFAEYAKNPTEENKQYALQLRNIRDTYVGRNANVMDDEGAILPWISQSGAQYLPQLGDQIKGVVGGGAIGGVIGAGIGSFAGPGGTAAGWKIGKHLGASVGSGASMYDVVKGAAVEGLVDEGVDIETASRMARDEGFLSAAIEAMETGGDIAVLSKLGWKGFALAYFLNIGSEMLQEGMQQGVSIATIDRAKRGEEISRNPILSTLDLAGDSMGTLLGAIWNPDSEEAQEIWEAAKEGGKISAIMGGATRMAGLAARYGVSKAVEAKDNQRMDNIGSEYQVAAEDLVNEGLSFEEGTEAHQTAQKLKAKLDAGETVSNKELAVLAAANDRAIGREASATVAENETVQPVNEALMRAAEEAVGIKKTDAVPFNVLNHNAQAATAAQSGVQSAVDRVAATQRKIEQKLSQPKYGRYGMDAFAELSESNTDNYDRMRTEFEAAYQAGLAELPRNAVTLINQTQEKAYQAGRQDYILSLEDNTRKGATVWGKKGGLVQNSESQKLDKQVQTQLDRFGRATGSKIIIDSRLVGTNQNGYYRNGEIHISPNTDRPLLAVARHEITHHLQVVAPEAYAAFRNYAVQKMNEGLPYGSVTKAEEMRSKYLEASEGDVDLTTEEAMDEAVAHFAEKILSDEKAMNDFVREVSKTQETRTWAQKFFDAVRDFVEKVKKVFGKGAKADQAVLDEYGLTVEQFEKAEKLWKDAIRAAGEQQFDLGKLTEAQAEAVEYSDLLTKFSLREKRSPKKTIIAYKAFYAHNGKLYPPMVSNLAETETKVSGKDKKALSGTLTGQETPVGVWLDADVGGIGLDKEGNILRTSDTGRIRVENAKGGGTLAFRPGWHLGEWPDAKQFNRGPLVPYTTSDGKQGSRRMLMPDGLVFAKCEIAADVDYQLEAMEYGVTEKTNKKGKSTLSDSRSQAGLPRVPEDGFYKYRTNVDPTTAPWYITGAMRVVEILDDDDCARICAQFGVTPDQRESGKKINLADYGLKRGPVTTTTDLDRFKKNQRNYDNEALLEKALNDPDYADAYRARPLDFDNTEVRKEFEINNQDADYYREQYEKQGKKFSLKIDTEGMNEDGKAVISRLKQQALFSKYDKGAFASYTPSRMDLEIRKSIYQGDDDAAMSHIAWIDPLDYIYATTTSQEMRDHLQQEAGKLDIERLRGEDQPIYLHVNKETGEIVGHEGRHRMIALRDAGVRKAAVVIYWSGTDNRDMQPIVHMPLKGQTFGGPTRGAGFTLDYALPLSARYADAARQLFSQVEGSVKFSLKDSSGRDLTEEQAEYFQESQVRDGKGRLKVVYHGTTAEFNTFERGDIGFHFGNKTTARTRVGRGKNTRLMECYLNITNPIEFDVDLGSWDADYRLAESLVDMGVLTGAEAQSVLRTDDGRYSRTTGSANRKLRELLVSKGYDGIVYSNYYESGGSKSYIVFESKQAKRVDNAAPTESPDIRFSLKEGNGPEVESAEPVNSKAFAEWFGDWKNDPKQASKVVDKNGKPLVVYHGTGTTIEEFLPEFTGQGVDQYGSGFYFTTEKDTAEGYMSRRLDGKTKPGGEDNPNVIPVYLNIRNPLVVDAREHPHLFDIEVPASKAKKIIELAPNIMHPEESILGDFVDEYWEVGPKKYMVDQLARMYDWSIGSLEGDLFRDNATAFREAAHKVLGYDGVQVNFPDGSRHYVAWFPNQIKHATENSGAFSKTDNRIKFSLKDQDTLMKENAKLKEVNQTLREQFKTTKFAKVDKKALDKFTKQLLKDYSSGADINDTRNALDSLYTYIANGEDGEGAVWEVAYRRAYDVAADILSEVGIMNDDLYQQYQGLRQHLRTTGLTISAEDRSSLASYGGYNEFRRANFGRIKLVNNGVPVDVAYGELAGMYPEFFDAYEHTHPADQLMHIAEILDSLEPYQVNPYSANMKESATWLANDIMERFFELPQAKPTFADKAERRLTQQVIKDQKKLDKLRERKNERIKEIIQDNREKVKQAQAKERQKRADAVKQTKEHYQAKEKRMSESRKATVLRTRIQRHAADLSKKLLHPTDKQHIPEDLRATVAALLENINLESQFTIDEMGKRHKGGDGEPVKRTEMFRRLAEQYQRITKEGSMVIDPSLLGDEETQGNFTKAIALGETRVADMGVKDLTTIWEVIRAVEHSITTANRVLSAAKYQETSDWANDINEETQSRRAMKGKDIEEIRLDLENPYTFFSHYGEAGQAIFRMLRDAQDRQEEMVLAVQKEVAHIVDPKMVKKLEETAQVFTTERGDKLTLTTAHMMEIHLLMKREQARDHLLKGGIVQPEVKSKKIVRGNDAILLTYGDLGKIIGKLTPEQLTIADELQRLTSTTLADYGNEASMKAYGYKKFTGTDYWPIKSAKEGIHSNIEKGGNNTRSIKNIGLAKSVMPHASNQLDIRGIFKTFESHAADMTDYAAWLCPMEDANRLYNFEFRDDNNIKTGKTMKGLLDTVGGKGSQEYWHRLMEDIQNGLKPPRDTWYSKALDKIVGNVKGASVGANIRVIAQQPTAILRAAVILSPVDMVAGLASGGGWQTALKHSAIAQRKDMGGFDISSPMQMGEILFGRQTGWQKFNEAMMWGAATADKVTWGRIWNACEHAIARQRPNLKKGSDTFYEAVDALFTEIIDQSQVVDGVLQRSQLMRSGDSVIRQATSFMGEPTMALNMVMRAYDAWRHESDAQKRTAGRKLLSRTIVVLVATNAVNALAQSLVDAWRDDEDDEEYWERVWHQLIGLEGDEKNAWDKAVALTLTGNLGSSLNPMTYVPGVKDVASILSGYDVTRMDADVIADVIKATQTFFDTLDGDSKKTRLYGLKEFAHNISKACGISAGNILRDVWGVMRSIVIESGNIGLLYKMEKVITNIEYEGNNSRFTDILYKAYAEGHGSYEHIYSDMVKNGIDPEKIADRMEKHMMKAQGVTKTSELEQRYLAPEQQIEYDDKMSRVQNNGLWRAANDDQRKELETDIYDLVVQNKSGEKLREDISEGADYGLSETEFLLYNLALEMVDQPNGSGKLGGAPTLSEKAAAIEEVGTLSDSDIAYLWDTEEGFEAFAEGIDMETYAKFKAFDSTTFADKDKNGKSISGSKKKKIRSYLIEEQVGQEAFDYFMYEVMGYKK